MKSLELTYEELGILLDLTLLSGAKTPTKPTTQLMEKLGELYREFTEKTDLAYLVDDTVYEFQVA